MAIFVATQRPRRRTRVRYLLGSLILAVAALLPLALLPPGPARLLALGSAAPAFWCLARWKHILDRARARRLVGNRLARLPDDFIVMDELTIPAPWGAIEIDHLILSRFGIVVVGDGPSPNWMTGQVEAIRSLLFSRGLFYPGLPIQPLVLLPPGVLRVTKTQPDCPVVRVEQIRLEHLAPNLSPILTPHQVREVADLLTHARIAA